jgi:hypothetical protein
LAGQYLEVNELSACDPIIIVDDLWTNQKFNMKVDANKNRIALDKEAPAIPCGLVAKSIFNDTFQLFKMENDGTKKLVPIIETGIAWSSDITYKFKNVEMPSGSVQTWEDVQWLDMTNGK